jgi:single-strand DNA-binding protein
MYYENEVRLIGCLGRDPEIRSFPNGGRVANLRLATTRKWKDRESGQEREETEWHSVAVTSDALVGLVERYTKKGSYLYVTGRLRTRKWQDQSGADRYTTEIMVSGFDGRVGFLDRQGGGQGDPGPSSDDRGAAGGGQGGGQGGGASNPGGGRQDLDDEIPF